MRTAGGELLTLGTPGGPCQTYTNANLLLRVLDHGADLQRAIDAPRWFLNAANVLQIEEPVSAVTRAQLAERGHVLASVPRHSAALGGAGMVRINAGGHSRSGRRPASRIVCARALTVHSRRTNGARLKSNEAGNSLPCRAPTLLATSAALSVKAGL